MPLKSLSAETTRFTPSEVEGRKLLPERGLLICFPQPGHPAFAQPSLKLRPAGKASADERAPVMRANRHTGTMPVLRVYNNSHA